MGKPANPKKITIKIDLCEKENAAFNLSSNQQLEKTISVKHTLIFSLGLDKTVLVSRVEQINLSSFYLTPHPECLNSHACPITVLSFYLIFDLYQASY